MKTGPRLQQRQDGTRLILTMDRVTQVDDGMYGCQLTTAEGLTVASATWTLRVSRKSSTPDPAVPLSVHLQYHVLLSPPQVCPSLQCSLASCRTAAYQRVSPSAWRSVWRENLLRGSAGSSKVSVPGKLCWGLCFHSKHAEVRGRNSSSGSSLHSPAKRPEGDGRQQSVHDGRAERYALAVCEPPSLVMWLHDGQEVSESEDFHLLREENRYTLQIQEVFPEDTGTYSCRARNQYGEDQTQAQLIVEAARGRPGRGSAGAATLRGGDRGGGGGEGSRLSLQQVAGEEQNLQNLQLLHLEEEKKEKEDLQAAPRGLLKRCVETRERGEEELQQREAQQLDFRSLLGRRAFPTSHTNVDTNTQHDHCHQMDFKANLRGVKGKPEEKMNSPQQVDFRSVLGKKGTSSSNGNKLAETPSKGSGDFRSVLSNKKKTETPEKNGESEKVNNCVDGGIHDQKSEGGGGGIVPEFMEKLKDVTVLDGQRLRLECRLDSTTAAGVTVTWTLDGKIIKPSKFIVLANEDRRCETKERRDAGCDVRPPSIAAISDGKDQFTPSINCPLGLHIHQSCSFL
ncbi:hypothetical protein XENOCAPTIV_019962 [Xenoophorus captivus]|uniref:Ig-like domain-containing protein n=1 Tax=Xenoophorus captivus TaxID=1517983 RepID=A0ABV0SB34_9TELE